MMTMKLTSLVMLAFSWAPTAAAAASLFHPQRISYESLLKGTAVGGEGEEFYPSFVKALSETGMISITGIPGMVSKTNQALSNLDGCLDQSQASQEFTLGDGTRRRTLATHSIPDGIQKIQHKSTAKECQSFDEASDALRSTVAQVTEAFADRISEFFFASGDDTTNTVPLLATANNNVLFNTFADVVENGEHLEHYHSYTKLDDNSSETETIELHVDQGLFIVFTPGRIMTPQDAQLTSGFYVQTQEGVIEEVEFTHEDELVFILGDGVNQYINDKIASPDKKLRATPHTLRMESSSLASRVWYGRMVLPPVDAVHPAHNDGATFGELRQRMIDASHETIQGLQDAEKNAGIGCSGGMVARDLQATTCEGDSIYCWHRCMNTTEAGVSEEICQAQNLQLHCVNPRLQIWGQENHGDYYPACADAAVQGTETSFPTLPNYPRSADLCSDAEFDSFADATGYDFVHDLPVGGRFMWSIVNGEVHGKIAYNGLFGWIAFGFAGPPGSGKNGMHAANVIMALPGGNYSAFSGVDLSMDPYIAEYEIHPTESSFRIWGSPLGTTAVARNEVLESEEGDAYTTESNDCFTSMAFTAASIGERTFNLQGKDELIWAANGEDSYVQYHGRDARGRFAIDWPTGKLTINGTEHDDHDDHDHDTSAASSPITLAVAVMALVLAFLNI